MIVGLFCYDSGNIIDYIIIILTHSYSSYFTNVIIIPAHSSMSTMTHMYPPPHMTDLKAYHSCAFFNVNYDTHVSSSSYDRFEGLSFLRILQCYTDPKDLNSRLIIVDILVI
jgi:hypothetical protein